MLTYSLLLFFTLTSKLNGFNECEFWIQYYSIINSLSIASKHINLKKKKKNVFCYSILNKLKTA